MRYVSMQLHIFLRRQGNFNKKILYPLFLERLGSSINNTLAFFCLLFTLFTCRNPKKGDMFAKFANDFGIKSRFDPKRQNTQSTYQSRPEWVTSHFVPHEYSLGYGRGLWETKNTQWHSKNVKGQARTFSQSCSDFTAPYFWPPVGGYLGAPHLPHYSPLPHG